MQTTRKAHQRSPLLDGSWNQSRGGSWRFSAHDGKRKQAIAHACGINGEAKGTLPIFHGRVLRVR